jgi:hypothetical protein
MIVTVYLDGRGMHYVILLGGQLVHVEGSEQFTVQDDTDVFCAGCYLAGG